MPTAFYFMKIRGDPNNTFNKLQELRGVEYVALVFGKYDAIVKVGGIYPTDIYNFWFETVKIPGVEIKNKALALKFNEHW